MPVYNNRSDVLGAISSVIKQSYENWELIIVDDCSTDGTYQVLEEFMKRTRDDKNIQLIRNKKNMGCYCSMNEGILRSTGDYITRIDSDDKFHRDKLKRQLNAFRACNCVAIMGLSERRDDEVLKVRQAEITLIFKKDIIDDIGYFDSIRFGADSEFISRIKATYGRRSIKILDHILYYARTREDSLTTSSITGITKNSMDGGLIRKSYVRKYKSWHRNNKNLYISYPLTNRPFIIHNIMKSK